MPENRILHFVCILLQIHWAVSNPQHHGHLDPYGNSKSFSPQQQQFDANQNFYVPNSQNSPPQYGNYVLATAAGQPFANDGNGRTLNHYVPYPYPTTSTSHSSSHLWSSAPIVVVDEAYNADRTSSGLENNLQTRPRNSKALDQTYNNNNNGSEGPQPLPSNYNYRNPTVYHSSDVWRQQLQQQQHQREEEEKEQQQQQHTHSIIASPQSREPSSSNYNQQQQQYQTPSSIYQQQQQARESYLSRESYQQQKQEQESYLSQQQQQQQHQLHASNTDLNYLQATPINHKPYFSAVSETNGDSGRKGETGKNSLNDYSQHFKEYLRKHPYRIQPTY